MRGRVTSQVGLVIAALSVGSAAAWAQDVDEARFRQLPRTLHVQIRIAYPTEPCEGGGTRMSRTAEIGGTLTRGAAPEPRLTEPSLYKGVVEVTDRRRECLSRCPDGDCNDACYVTSQSSGAIALFVDYVEPPMRLWWRPRKTQESLPEHGCPPRHYPTRDLLEDARTEYSLIVNVREDAWPSLREGTFTLYDGQPGGGGTRVGTMQVVAKAGVVAHAGGPYSAQRGASVTLDGSRSRGLGLSYEWRFTPRDCPADARPNPAFKAAGARPRVTLLCSMNVTLKVTDGANEDSQTVPITVTKRPWQTPFEHVAEEGTSFYARNKELGGDIDGYLTAIRAHEGMADAKGVLGHSGLIRKTLRGDGPQRRGVDPAGSVETMFSSGDRAALRNRVDEVLRDADHQLCEGSKDPLPAMRSTSEPAGRGPGVLSDRRSGVSFAHLYPRAHDGRILLLR